MDERGGGGVAGFGGWWLVAGGWWLVAGGWWLVRRVRRVLSGVALFFGNWGIDGLW
jgi:hypothetical protein